MRATCWAGVTAGIVTVSGCAWGLRGAVLTAGYGASSRPDPTYYCYDCHGYRFFDPYYDWCTTYGFSYDWRRRPRMISLYRQRYLEMKLADRGFGRYSYPGDYRSRPRYLRPRDYESWRREQRERAEGVDPILDRPVREHRPVDPGRKDRRDRRPAKGARSAVSLTTVT